MTNLIETEYPPLIIDENTKWKNPINGEVYDPILRILSWVSGKGIIYPFRVGTEFSYRNIFDGNKMVVKISANMNFFEWKE